MAMPMNQSMLPLFMQMMQQQGGGMPQMQNNAPQLNIAQGGQRSGPQQMPMPQPQQQQQQPGGAVQQAVNSGKNIGQLYQWGNQGYNALNGMMGSNAPGGAAAPGATFTGASPQSGMMNNTAAMGPTTSSPSGLMYGSQGAMPPSAGYFGYGSGAANGMGAGASGGGLFGGGGASGMGANGATGAGGMFGSTGATGLTGASGGDYAAGALGMGGGSTGLGVGGSAAGGNAAAGTAGSSSMPEWLSSLLEML